MPLITPSLTPTDELYLQSLVFTEEGAPEVADRRRRIHSRLLALQTHYRTQVTSSLRTFPSTYSYDPY